MKALCWYGTNDVRVENVPDPQIQDSRDAIIKITSTAICGSDLHLVNGFQPTMEAGDVLGHENMGEVVEVGSGITNLKVGDKVVVPFVIACGQCFFCQKEMYSLCDTSNPNAAMAREAMGNRPPDCSVFRICSVDLRAVKPNICAFRSPMSDRLKFPTAFRTRKFYSFLIFSRRLIWQRKIWKSKKATQWRFGAAVRSVNWRSNARGCSAQVA